MDKLNEIRMEQSTHCTCLNHGGRATGATDPRMEAEEMAQATDQMTINLKEETFVPNVKLSKEQITITHVAIIHIGQILTAHGDNADNIRH